MKKFLIEKKKKEVKLFFLNLIDVDLIIKIINLFNGEYLFGECFLEKEQVLETDYFLKIEEIKIEYLENARKHKQLIIGVPKKYLKEFFDISEKFDTTLSGSFGKKDDWLSFFTNRKLIESDVSFVINDNNGSCINFNRKKYDYNKIIEKIRLILS